MNKSNPHNPLGESSPPNTLVRRSVDEHALRRYGGVLGAVSLVAALGFVCWMLLLSSGPSLFGFGVAGLIAMPYLLICLACKNLRFWFSRVILALTLAGCCLFGIYAFDAVDKDAQGGLFLIVAPIYQLAATFVLVVFAAVTDRVWRGYPSGLPRIGVGGGS